MRGTDFFGGLFFSRMSVLVAGMVFCSWFVLSGCSPSLGNGELRVAPLKVNAQSPSLSGLEVFVDTVEDNRRNKDIGIIEGRPLVAEGDVLGTIRYALEKALTRNGARLSSARTSSARVTLEHWFLEVQPEFPFTKARAVAEIRVEVISPEGDVAYSGKYEGARIMQNLFPDKADTEETLQAAMSHAIAAALEDRDFVAALANSTRGGAEPSHIDVPAKRPNSSLW